MATTKQKTKQEYEEWVDEDTELAEDFSDKLNRLFYRMLKNPSDSEMDNFKTVRDALIIAFILDLMDKYKNQFKLSSQVGFNNAINQLKAKDITKIVKKKLSDEKVLNLYKSRLNEIQTILAYVLDGVKINSDRAIREIKSNIVETKKVITTQLAEEFSKYGIAYYTDSAGRRQSINNYIKTKTLTTLLDIQRHTFFNTAIARGVDLVRVIHLGISPIECPLCLPYSGKVLSINGETEGYETVVEAMSNGLFTHENCDHTTRALELAPTDIKDSDKVINHSEENKKRKEYYKRKGYKFYI